MFIKLTSILFVFHIFTATVEALAEHYSKLQIFSKFTFLKMTSTFCSLRFKSHAAKTSTDLPGKRQGLHIVIYKVALETCSFQLLICSCEFTLKRLARFAVAYEHHVIIRSPLITEKYCFASHFTFMSKIERNCWTASQKSSWKFTTEPYLRWASKLNKHSM